MKKSFTLVELLIVVGILMVLAIISISIISAMRQQRQTKEVAQQVKTRIMEAHTLAVSPPVKDKNDSDITNLTSIEVQIKNNTSPNPPTLEIVGNPGSGVKTFVSEDLSPKVRFNKNNIVINFSAAGDNIGQLTPSSDQTFQVIGNSKTYAITINQYTGNVDIQSL